MKKIICFSLVTVCFFCLAIKSNAQWNLTGNSNATATSILGTTTSVPLNLTTNNVQRLVIDANGKIGIGTTTPINILTVKGAGSTPAPSWVAAGAPLFVGFGENAIGNADYILAMASTSNNGRPVFVGRRSRGTLAAPTAMANNDFIMSLLASAHDGTAFQNPATIDFFVDGIPTAGNVPARISFVTGSNSSNRAERLKVGSTGDFTFNTNQLFLQKLSGNIGVGTITPSAKLEVAGQVKITGGTPGTGKVLTSDASGLASWTAPTVLPTGTNNKTLRYSGTTLVANSLLSNTGSSIGIGESNPQGILHVSQPFSFAGVTFAGSGLNDMSVNTSGYNGTGTTAYIIRIQNAGSTPNLIEISNDGGSTFSAPFAISNPVILTNGVTASFASTTGHTFGDEWIWSVGESFNNELVVKNGKTGIRTANPDATLHIAGNVKIADGTQGNGKVLTSDSNGKASWQSVSILETDPKVGALSLNKIPHWNGTALVNGSITDSAGFVGIGTGNPKALLEVNEDALINGLTVGRGNNKDTTNTALGRGALTFSTTGFRNTATGQDALFSNTTGSLNTANGWRTLRNNTTGTKNTATGAEALLQNTTGSFNTADGYNALQQNTNGSFNTANGTFTLRNNENGSFNTAYGHDALFSNTSGFYNTATGQGALENNTTGSRNTANGNEALFDNTTGFSNVAIGISALRTNTVKNNLVAIGDSALFNNGMNATFPSEAINNTAVGSKVLFANTKGNDNTATGFNSLITNTTGSFNTANGSYTLYYNTTGNANTANGSQALGNNTTGSFNTATGNLALVNNTTGSSNTANGNEAMLSNTTGFSNVAMGLSALRNNKVKNNLVAIGDSALFNNGMNATLSSEAINNTAVGSKVLFANTKGNDNTAIGFNSLILNTTGSFNTANGSYALNSNRTGNKNTAVGSQTLSSNTSGNFNTANGTDALLSNTSGSFNTAIGNSALFTNTTSSHLVAIGDSALFSQNNSGLGENTAVGSRALFSNTSGYFNSANGSRAMFSNTTGDKNTANGTKTLFSNTTGNNNTANGLESLFSNTTGSNNTATGAEALLSNTIGTVNTANGVQALVNNTTGSSNTAIGYIALSNNTTGSSNTANGRAALFNNTTAQFNTAVGYDAGANFTNGFNNVFLGANADVNQAGIFNAIVIGESAVGTASSQVTIGNSSSNSYRVFANWTNISDGRYKKNVQQNVPGLAFINKLNPVTYTLDAAGLDGFLNKNKRTDSAAYFYKQALADREKIVYTGFIAQDVEKAAKELNYDFSGVDKPANDKDVYGLRYAEFVVPLVKAVQELSKKNEELGITNEELKTTNNYLVKLQSKDKADLQKQIDELKDALIKLVNQQKCVPTTGK